MHWVQSILRSGYPLCNIYDFFAAAPSEIVFADRGVASMLNNAAMMVFQKSTGGTLQIGCSACKLLSVLPAHTFAVTAIAELPVKLVEWASIEMQLQNGERVAAEAALAHHVEKIVVGLLQKCWSLAQSPEQAAVSSGVAALHAGLREETMREAHGAGGTIFSGAVEMFLPAIPLHLAPLLCSSSAPLPVASVISSVLARIAAIDHSGSYTVTAVRGLAQMRRFDILAALGRKVVPFVVDRHSPSKSHAGTPDQKWQEQSLLQSPADELSSEMQTIFELYACLFHDAITLRSPRLAGEKTIQILRAFAWSIPPGPVVFATWVTRALQTLCCSAFPHTHVQAYTLDLK